MDKETKIGDNKFSDLGVEIEAKINRRVERDQEFRRGVLNLLKRHALVEKEEFVQLEACI
ncbi:MAG: hypothetical protein UX10_C0025G0006 [Candidatus Magasanikbacteria bacterium GW2011_GWA2_45_39]|uniref:Uncharacterized protein n=2 Tax=Candidatus Magasanikiibacteriota TaxID=1752731 RepID=A0A0G1MXC6_9BACT|nr:MAG: hypothetical protein UX10_C0025G0006 [Candidatus Magasanikbacteria bacterium GW2011_GWA2_45_39]KKU12889.1 MAG: hypothetical protein UX20_C0038G0004 [Candidatus Magasanikbacteria bacterium GW2011_GWC2_45_8]HBW74420.1 hypothetical protein [Candidatus Magasanikbacteria bacterium]